MSLQERGKLALLELTRLIETLSSAIQEVLPAQMEYHYLSTQLLAVVKRTHGKDTNITTVMVNNVVNVVMQ